ncbi:MAG: glycerol kinase GlpK [Opitutales bacterium]|nr:glycerol kinase GlpK [Opitutales bacterium]
MPRFLVIDQSTSATKALLFDASGRVLDRESRDHRQHYPRPGWVEHDASEIRANTFAALNALLARHGDDLGDIRSLSLTNQRETVVVFDRQTGEPLAPAVVWQCRRGAPLCEAHLEAGHGDTVAQRTGLRIDPYFSASKLQWLVENNSTVAARLADGSAAAGTIDAFLIHALTEGKVLATDHTNACRTLLYNIDRLEWDADLCKLWKVPRRALPEVRDSTAAYGETDLGGLLPRAVPIQGVMGDSHASLLAQRCFEPGSAKVTFGTGSSILMTLGPQRRDSSRGVVTTLAWVHGGQPTYAFEGIVISSASTLVWLRDQLGILPGIAEAESIARSIPDNGGVYLVPAFTGLGLPHWKPEARAAVTGLSAQSDRRHIVRAALESIAYQLRDALDAMGEDAGAAPKAVHADGGPTANNFLMQFTADLTGARLRVADTSDGSPLGAVLAGMWGAGILNGPAAIAALPHEGRTYTPQLDEAEVARLYDGWQAAVRKTLA